MTNFRVHLAPMDYTLSLNQVDKHKYKVNVIQSLKMNDSLKHQF